MAILGCTAANMRRRRIRPVSRSGLTGTRPRTAWASAIASRYRPRANSPCCSRGNGTRLGGFSRPIVVRAAPGLRPTVAREAQRDRLRRGAGAVRARLGDGGAEHRLGPLELAVAAGGHIVRV